MGAPPRTYPLHILTVSTLNSIVTTQWHRLTARSTRIRAARFSNEMMFGLVRGRTMLVFDLVSTLSLGWMTSS